MLGLPAFFGKHDASTMTDDEVVRMAREASDGDDETSLPTGLLRRLAEAAEKALESCDTETVSLEPGEVAPLKAQIVTVVEFLEACLLRSTGSVCRVRLAAKYDACVSIRARILSEPET